MKASERRGDRWQAAFGREQTELDAAVAMAPEAFSRVIDKVLGAYWDRSPRQAGSDLRRRLEAEANDLISEAIGDPAAINERLADANAIIDEIRELLAPLDQIEMPEVGMIEGEAPGLPEPLFDSHDSYGQNTDRLKARKAY